MGVAARCARLYKEALCKEPGGFPQHRDVQWLPRAGWGQDRHGSQEWRCEGLQPDPRLRLPSWLLNPPPQGPWATSEEHCLVIPTWGQGAVHATGIQWVEARDAANHPAIHRKPQQQRLVQSRASIALPVTNPAHCLPFSHRGVNTFRVLAEGFCPANL